MFKYLAGVGALALVASPLIAQDQEEPVEGKDNFGTVVRDLAKGQRDAETKGIGAEVSEQAKARAEERRAARGDDEDDDDAEEAAEAAAEDSEEDAATGRANAAEGSAAALAEAVAGGGADNAGVKDNTGAVADLRAARSGREFGAEARAAAADSRQVAAEARAAANQAREQAQTIRDTVRNARPGRGG
jgi:hypothetical protein